MNEKMSIIIPVYNVEAWLEECLDSLLNQTYENIEVILINDGSTDSSLDICEVYAKKDSRIQVFSQENKGQATARNHGLEKVTGDYILFMDSDDYLIDQACIEKFIQIFQEKKCEVIYTSYCRFEDETREIIEDLSLQFTQEEIEELTGQQLLELLISRKSYYHAPYQKICKKSFLTKHQILFKEGYFHEDVEWTARVLYHASSVYAYFNRWYMRRMRENSTITTKDETIILKKAMDRMKLASELSQFFIAREVLADSVILQDLAQMYWGDLLILPTLKNKQYLAHSKEVIDNTKKVLLYEKSKKVRISYSIMRLIGTYNFLLVMKKVMKK